MAGSTASKIFDGIMKTIPLEWVLPVVFDKILATIKNPNSTKAKALEKTLVSFGKSLAAKYPGQICEEESTDDEE